MSTSENNPALDEALNAEKEDVSDIIGNEDEIKDEAEGEISDNEKVIKTQDDHTCEINYEELAREDMRTLIEQFPHLQGKRSVAELENPLRYAALRDLGLTPREAYLATSTPNRPYDNRSHLTSAVPKGAAPVGDMLDARGLEAARELFAGLSDREIQRLYKKVSK